MGRLGNDPINNIDSLGLKKKKAETELEMPDFGTPEGDLDMPEEPEQTIDRGPATCKECEKRVKLREINITEVDYSLVSVVLTMFRDEPTAQEGSRFKLQQNEWACVSINAVQTGPDYSSTTWKTGSYMSSWTYHTAEVIDWNYN